jgi:hypothetical protein
MQCTYFFTVLFSIYELGDCNSTLFAEFQSVLADEEEPMVRFYSCMHENETMYPISGVKYSHILHLIIFRMKMRQS